MKTIYTIIYVLLSLLALGCVTKEPQEKSSSGLKDVFEGKFLIGTALDTLQIKGEDTLAIELVKQHFNALVAENCMKAERIFSKEWTYDFRTADQFVDFGVKNNMFMHGHTLVWHSQVPDWFFTDEEGNEVSREVLIERMKDHIFALIGRYKGRVTAWDVVNEAFENDGSLRESKYYKIIGPDYFKLAFEFAHEADPDAKLYYNDYAMTIPSKRDGIIAFIRELQKDSVPIHGVGMQGHYSLDNPSIERVEQSILKLSELNIPVMITELDITVLPWPEKSMTADVGLSHEFNKKYDPYSAGLPDSVDVMLNQKYYELFKMFEKHSDKIDRVTLWGVNDTQSWRNYWPIETRTDYPLLFDREYKAKPVVERLITESTSI
ncbi:endo-1,4-beta-xylanase [Plebeiibacterium sediminum]|uniref:Beta-xylanase n=1 Tax=Plebeiibacterium sediminum TaxID=2992112 RepID=A0AAE3M1U1_9BACT|nr:endo-1,4-beta-xylanase [Plebeiobacterium sediminum]MCW3785579.1 endo-1,4-beta-xylanase [Plebeiobacterium sediminum]